MTERQLRKLFEANDDDYLAFERVTNKRSQRPDLHAFLLLDALVPGNMDIIGGAEHDEFFLDVNVEELAKVITPDQVLALVRCGVRWDSDTDGLAMYA